MLGTRRLVLAGHDLRLAQVVQSHLQKTLGIAPPVVRFEDVNGLLTPETDGALVLLASDPSDINSIEQVVREARLQLFPTSIGVVTNENLHASRTLDQLQPHLSGVWAWPHQMRELANWARRGVSPGVSFADPLSEDVPDRIRRKLLCHTPSLIPMVDQLAIAAAHDVTVLIEGETGTGKSYLAKLVHDCSARRDHRFLVVACGTLSGNLIASEFFGHVKGAFTGADTNKVGKFAAAGEGTLLLDEIDALGLEHQANLLRVIETGEFEPVGGNETQYNHARIVAATNWNLAEAVERGTFRRDLYYRLHVINFHLPPLRHRPADIGPLARGMIARYSSKYNKKLFSIDSSTLEALESFPWPGNIRQLENVVQQAVLTSTGSELKLHHMPPSIHMKADTTVTPMPVGNGVGTLKQNRETSERSNIVRALEKSSQSRTRAAQILGVSRVTLYKKMKKYGLLPRTNNGDSLYISDAHR